MRFKTIIDELYAEYNNAATNNKALIMSKTGFERFFDYIDLFNENVMKDDKVIQFGDQVFELTTIPFDARLSALLTPKSVTHDVYDIRQRDLMNRNPFEDFKSYSLNEWLDLQTEFFKAFRGKVVNESQNLADFKQHLTLAQVADRIYTEVCVGGTDEAPEYQVAENNLSRDYVDGLLAPICMRIVVMDETYVQRMSYKAYCQLLVSQVCKNIASYTN